MPCKTHAPSLSMTSNHETPRNSATPASHSPSSSNVAPRKLKPARGPAAHQLAEHAAGAVRQGRPVPMQRRQAAAREQRQHEPDRAQQRVEARARFRQRVIHVHQPAGIGQHERETDRPAGRTRREKTRPATRLPVRSNCSPDRVHRCPRSRGRAADRTATPAATAAPAHTISTSVPSRKDRDTAAESFRRCFEFFWAAASVNSRSLMIYNLLTI